MIFVCFFISHLPEVCDLAIFSCKEGWEIWLLLAGYTAVPAHTGSPILREENLVDNGYSVLIDSKLFTCIILFNPSNGPVK